VSSAAGTVADSAISNTSSFSWLPDASIGTSRVTANGNTVNATVVEPSITLTKNENDADDIVVPNDTLTYTLVVAAGTGANRSSAHDVQVVDTIPAGVTVVNAGTPVADGGAVNPDGGTWNQTARTITWNVTTTAAKLDSIAPGTNASLTYDVVVDDPATSGSIFTNTVAASATSMIGTITGERTTYSANATDTVSAPMATIVKSVSPSTATIGDTVTYTIDATVPAGITTYDATVIDVLPDGMDFDAFGSVAATGNTTGCPSLAGMQGIVNQTNNADGSTTIGFWIDDFTSSSANNCTVRFTYTARVDNTYVPEGTNVMSGNALVNTVRMYWNNTNSVSSLPANPPGTGTFVRSSSPATAAVTVNEPVLRIDKDVSQSPCNQVPGDIGDNDICNTDIGTGTYTYTLTITNSSSWAAHDITVVDAPDTDLVNVTVPASAGTITVVDGAAPNLQWQISTIAANSTATITYTAQLAASAALNDGEQIVNTADVTEYYARSAATRSADPVAEWRTYGQGGAGGDVTADTVTMTVGFPNVTIVKTTVDDATDARVGVGAAAGEVQHKTAACALLARALGPRGKHGEHNR
jgi:fimbrial isopeptide formation D2 family protein